MSSMKIVKSVVFPFVNLYNHFQSYLELEKFSSEWKNVNVVLVHKNVRSIY